MSAGQYRLEIDSGTSFNARIRPMHGTVPIDLTGTTVKFLVRDARADWIDDLSESCVLSSDSIHISLTPEQTKKWTANHRYYMALDVISPDGTRRRYLQGPLFVRNLGVAG